MSAEQICGIIKTAAKSGVNSLKFGELVLEFGEPNQKPHVPPQITPTRENEETIIKEARDRESLIAHEDYLAHLKISDPVAYEEMIQGEVEGVGGSA